MRHITLLAALLVVAFTCGGCQKELYEWGEYEPSVRRMYDKNKDFEVTKEIARLSEEVKRSESNGRKPPPGKYAYLGYLHTLAQNNHSAIAAFEAEKRLFPESQPFMDDMIRRAQ